MPQLRGIMSQISPTPGRGPASSKAGEADGVPTMRSRLTPLRAATSLASSLLAADMRNTETGVPSSLLSPLQCVQLPQDEPYASPTL